jgi:hypothetical protein
MNILGFFEVSLVDLSTIDSKVTKKPPTVGVNGHKTL